MIVVDTNLIVYLLINGEHSGGAEAVYQRDPSWFAPPLWRHEFANALALYVRKNLLAIEHAVELDRRARSIVMGSGSPGLRELLELSQQSGCSTYDCEFVALARFHAVPLVTADKKVLIAFPQVAMSPDAFIESRS